MTQKQQIENLERQVAGLMTCVDFLLNKIIDDDLDEYDEIQRGIQVIRQAQIESNK